MRKNTSLVAIALSALIFAPVTALALPSCLDLRDNPAYGLAGRADVLNLTASLTTTGANARCEINFIYSSRGGPEFGYDEGEQQRVAIRVGLPRNSGDGGAGGIEGAWNGRTRALGGGGCVGSVGSVTSATSTGWWRRTLTPMPSPSTASMRTANAIEDNQ
jgi:hypothetical protein